jgi:FkbM family methyltransferase
MAPEPRVAYVRDPIDESTFAISGDPDDYSVIGAIERSGGRYEEALLTAAGKTMQEDAVVLDIGANIGLFSAYAARRCPRGTVHAFEPGETNLAHLRRNLTLNDLTNVRVNAMGLYDRTGTLVFNFTADNPAGSFITDTDVSAGTAETVQVSTLDDWAREADLDRLDLVKMDVEGSELRVLEGGDKTLREFRPALFAECNPIPLRRFQRASPHELVDLLHDIYGRVSYLREGGVCLRLRNRRHLDIELERQGIVELACGIEDTPGFHWDRAVARRVIESGIATAVMPRLGLGRFARGGFVHAPDVRVEFELPPRTLTVGAAATVPVRVTNITRSWWSSTFVNSPVTVGHRWLGADGTAVDGLERGLLASPVAPGRSAEVSCVVHAPDQPGDYRLVVTMVQEGYVWFDDMEPTAKGVVDITVTAATEPAAAG